MKKEFLQVEVGSVKELRKWLAGQAKREEGVWLVTYKKVVPEKYIAYEEIVANLLCYGWIDSVPRKLDDERRMLFISPRRRGSAWSRVNKQHISRMIKEKKMTPAGMQKINDAKKDGSWTFLDDVEALILPDDLKTALSKNKALENWQALPRRKKRSALETIKMAKTEKTRTKRIQQTVLATSQKPLSG